MPSKIKRSAETPSHSNDISESDNSSSENEHAAGNFNEGRSTNEPSPTNSASTNKRLTPICPAPVRISIGVFSTLVAVGGCVMSVLGANGLYDLSAPDHSVHRGLLGGGLTLVAAGGFGILSTFLEREQAQGTAQA